MTDRCTPPDYTVNVEIEGYSNRVLTVMGIIAALALLSLGVLLVAVLFGWFF